MNIEVISPKEEINNIIKIADDYLLQGDFDKAKYYYDKAVDTCKEKFIEGQENM